MTTPPTRSRRLLGAFALALGASLLTGCSLLDSVISGVPEGEADVFTIAIGDCLNDASVSDEVTSVPLVECSEPHDSEVFARSDSTSASFPGDAALSDELTTFCTGDAFTDFVGIPYFDSIYETSGYFPTEGSWGDGDRELLCTIWDPAGQVTGSLSGIGR